LSPKLAKTIAAVAIAAFWSIRPKPVEAEVAVVAAVGAVVVAAAGVVVGVVVEVGEVGDGAGAVAFAAAGGKMVDAGVAISATL
jgi:hypothetical protein